MKRIAVLTLLAASAFSVSAADDDFGIWTSVSLQKDFSKKFSVDAGIGFRAEDCLKQAARWDVQVGATYKPAKFLNISAGYTFIHARNGQEVKIDYKKKLDDDGNLVFNGYNVDHGYWRNRHRATFDVSGKVSVQRFTFSVRERYQFTRYMAATTTRDKYRSELPSSMSGVYTGTVYEYDGREFTTFSQTADEKNAKSRHYLRSRFMIEYDIRHCPVDPYLSYEFHNNLSDALKLKKSRLMAGVEWRLSKKHRLDFAYVFQNSHDDDAEGNLHAISIDYKFKF